MKKVSNLFFQLSRFGITCLDVKPENIMLKKDPREGYIVKLIDFGVYCLDDKSLPQSMKTVGKFNFLKKTDANKYIAMMILLYVYIRNFYPKNVNQTRYPNFAWGPLYNLILQESKYYRKYINIQTITDIIMRKPAIVKAYWIRNQNKSITDVTLKNWVQNYIQSFLIDRISPNELSQILRTYRNYT